MSNERYYLIKDTLNLLYKARENIDKIEGKEGYVMGDSITELIDALEFEEMSE